MNQCLNCGEFGHRSKDCWNDKFCQRCGSGEHQSHACTTPLDDDSPDRAEILCQVWYNAKRHAISKGYGEEDAERMADLVLSNLSLHWINDLAGALTQVRRVLKPDGCFIGSLLGGSTLHELRYCLYLAEQERRGGVSPHASPLITPSDMAALMAKPKSGTGGGEISACGRTTSSASARS